MVDMERAVGGTSGSATGAMCSLEIGIMLKVGGRYLWLCHWGNVVRWRSEPS